MATKKKARVKKVKVVKVEPTAEPEVCLVGLELEVEGAPEIPQEPLPVEPLELADTATPPHQSGWAKWIKSLWS